MQTRIIQKEKKHLTTADIKPGEYFTHADNRLTNLVFQRLSDLDQIEALKSSGAVYVVVISGFEHSPLYHPGRLCAFNNSTPVRRLRPTGIVDFEVDE